VGNAAAVVGMAQCLTSFGDCWDEGDSNEAGHCMQGVISAYGDGNIHAIATTVASLGCLDSPDAQAIATELSNADRVLFAACRAQIQPGDAACSATTSGTCLAKTHYNASLCQN
jgi:hypothetical protein